MCINVNEQKTLGYGRGRCEKRRKINIGRESEHLGCRWLTQAKRKGNQTADVTLMADELLSAVEPCRAQAPGRATYAIKPTARHSDTAPSNRCQNVPEDGSTFIRAVRQGEEGGH